MNKKFLLPEKCYIFRDKTPEEMEKILENTRLFIQTFYPGEKIVSQGDRADFLGVVLEGKVSVKKVYSTGRALTLATFEEGQAFGESVLFSVKPSYPADIIAQEKTEVFRIPREDLLQLFQKDGDVLLRYLETISNRVKMLSEKIELLSLGTIKQKIAHYLLREARIEGENCFPWKFSREELADYFNIPRPSLSRELAGLKDQGLIDFDRKRVEIKDTQGLEELLME